MRENIRLEQPTKEREVTQKLEGLPVTARQRAGLKFVYVHYPNSWRFDLQRGWLPRLHKIYAKPGVNGITKSGDMTTCLAHLERKGATAIRPTDERLGDFKDYCHYYPTRTGGRWYVDFCQTAVVLPNDEIVWNDSEIEGPLLDFARHVLRVGIVRPMLKEVFVQALEAERAKLENLFGRMDRNPHLKAKADECEKRLAKMQEAWEAQSGRLLNTSKPVTPKKRIG